MFRNLNPIKEKRLMWLTLGKLSILVILVFLYFYGARLYFLYLLLKKKEYERVMACTTKFKSDVSWTVCYLLRKVLRQHNMKIFEVKQTGALVLSLNEIPYSIAVFRDKKKRLELGLPTDNLVCRFDVVYEPEGDDLVSIHDIILNKHLQKVIDTFMPNIVHLVVKLKEK